MCSLAVMQTVMNLTSSHADKTENGTASTEGNCCCSGRVPLFQGGNVHIRFWRQHLLWRLCIEICDCNAVPVTLESG